MDSEELKVVTVSLFLFIGISYNMLGNKKFNHNLEWRDALTKYYFKIMFWLLNMRCITVHMQMFSMHKAVYDTVCY